VTLSSIIKVDRGNLASGVIAEEYRGVVYQWHGKDHLKADTHRSLQRQRV
jgi:hypothetical protein